MRISELIEYYKCHYIKFWTCGKSYVYIPEEIEADIEVKYFSYNPQNLTLVIWL